MRIAPVLLLLYLFFIAGVPFICGCLYVVAFDFHPVHPLILHILMEFFYGIDNQLSRL